MTKDTFISLLDQHFRSSEPEMRTKTKYIFLIVNHSIAEEMTDNVEKNQ